MFYYIIASALLQALSGGLAQAPIEECGGLSSDLDTFLSNQALNPKLDFFMRAVDFNSMLVYFV